MRIANRFLQIPMVLMAVMLLTACAPNHVPFYVAGKVETLAAVRKQQEMANYLNQFEDKRLTFEAQLDRFYINSLRESEEKGLLTASGIAYLNHRESEMRAEFDANEARELAQLESNIKFYDDIIELQGMTVASIQEAERQNAQAFQELVIELGEFAIAEAEEAAERRREWLEKQANQPVPQPEEPEGETVEIIEHQPTVHSAPEPAPTP